MGFILIILFIIPAVCLILGLRFLREYNKIKSTENYESEAKKKAAELTYKDPVISCDYCGNAIDTGKDKKCPVCGGEYSLDKEWIERHRIDMDEFDRAADAHSKQQIKKYDKAASSLLKLFKVFLIIGCSIFLLFLILFISFLISESVVTYQKSETVNFRENDNYQREAYEIKDNAVFFEYEGVSAEVTGIYRDEAQDRFKIEVTLKNYSSFEKVRISYYLRGANDFVENLTTYHTEHSRAMYLETGKEIKVYETISDSGFDGIRNLYFSQISLYDKDTFFVDDDDIHRVDTTFAGGKIADDFYDGMEKLFENESMVIYVLKNEGKDSDVYFVNKTDEVFNIKSDSAKVNDNKLDYFSFGYTVPAGATLMEIRLRSSDTHYRDMSESDGFYVNFTVTCPEKSSLSFFTDYLKIR